MHWVNMILLVENGDQIQCPYWTGRYKTGLRSLRES